MIFFNITDKCLNKIFWKIVHAIKDCIFDNFRDIWQNMFCTLNFEGSFHSFNTTIADKKNIQIFFRKLRFIKFSSKSVIYTLIYSLWFFPYKKLLQSITFHNCHSFDKTMVVFTFWKFLARTISSFLDRFLAFCRNLNLSKNADTFCSILHLTS